MNYDRLAIRRWIRQIAEVDLDRPEPLQQLLYGLDALIRVHLWKEDELYRPLLEPFFVACQRVSRSSKPGAAPGPRRRDDAEAASIDQVPSRRFRGAGEPRYAPRERAAAI